MVARQYKRRLDNQFVWYYDLVDYDETFVFQEEIVSGKPVIAKAELERRFPHDRIEPVPKGMRGADIVQGVRNGRGEVIKIPNQEAQARLSLVFETFLQCR